MSAVSTLQLAIAGFAPQVEFDVDDRGVTAAHPIFPPIWEIALQTVAFAAIVYAIYKFGGPSIKKYYSDRTERIQREMDEGVAAKAAAESEALRIRTSLGDIETERQQILSEARAQAEGVLAEGRIRLDDEAVELEARATDEIASIVGRSGDELRAQITRHTNASIDQVVVQSLDDSLHQQLIEDVIARVGAATGPASGNGASA
jgi:F0F1-type ATP synthase membrane subunit b/b'